MKPSYPFHFSETCSGKLKQPLTLGSWHPAAVAMASRLAYGKSRLHLHDLWWGKHILKAQLDLESGVIIINLTLNLV